MTHKKNSGNSFSFKKKHADLNLTLSEEKGEKFFKDLNMKLCSMPFSPEPLLLLFFNSQNTSQAAKYDGFTTKPSGKCQPL